jgi:hypothetical protein
MRMGLALSRRKLAASTPPVASHRIDATVPGTAVPHVDRTRAMPHRTARVLTAVLILFWPLPSSAQSPEETAYVLGLMRAMNQLSVRFNREVCGFVLRDRTGRYSSTKVSWGGEATCASLPLQPGVTAMSSWHTHAGWDPDYDGEVPSIQDVEGDMTLGVNGWVATPGGRLWFVEGGPARFARSAGAGAFPPTRPSPPTTGRCPRRCPSTGCTCGSGGRARRPPPE